MCLEFFLISKCGRSGILGKPILKWSMARRKWMRSVILSDIALEGKEGKKDRIREV
jgi:hypothetical protein